MKLVTTPWGIQAILVFPDTARGQRMLSSYYNSAATDLKDVYKKPSSAKEKAYKECRELYDQAEGERFRITGKNCDSFSVAFLCNKSYVLYITKDNYYIIPAVKPGR